MFFELIKCGEQHIDLTSLLLCSDSYHIDFIFIFIARSIYIVSFFFMSCQAF